MFVEGALKGAERFLEIKKIFAENNIPLTDETALKVLELLNGREIGQDEAFERMIEFAVQLWILKEGKFQPNLAEKKDEAGDDINNMLLDDIFSGFRGISKTLEHIPGVTTLGELRNYISKKGGIKGLLKTRGIGLTRLCDIYICLRRLSNPPMDIIEQIEEYYKSKTHTQPSKYFFMRLKDERIDPLKQ